jgi:hypothetical protein
VTLVESLKGDPQRLWQWVSRGYCLLVCFWSTGN